MSASEILCFPDGQISTLQYLIWLLRWHQPTDWGLNCHFTWRWYEGEVVLELQFHDSVNFSSLYWMAGRGLLSFVVCWDGWDHRLVCLLVEIMSSWLLVLLIWVQWWWGVDPVQQGTRIPTDWLSPLLNTPRAAGQLSWLLWSAITTSHLLPPSLLVPAPLQHRNSLLNYHSLLLSVGGVGWRGGGVGVAPGQWERKHWRLSVRTVRQSDHTTHWAGDIKLQANNSQYTPTVFLKHSASVSFPPSSLLVTFFWV